MQKLKSKVFEKFQIENKMKSLNALPKNPVFQSVVAALFTVGMLSWLNIRPLGLFFFTVFCFWVLKHYCSVRIKTPPELQTYLTTAQHRILDFRKRKPAMFAITAATCLVLFAMMGNIVFCGIILYSILASGIFTATEFTIFNRDRQGLEGLTIEELVDEVLPEEFVLEANASNMYVLERASDLSSATFPTDDGEDDEDRSDEVPSELLIPDPIPEIDENSTDDDQDDLLPTIELPTSHNLQSTSTTPATDLLATTSQANATIEFKKGHFKRDSSLSTSSSSEESLSKGLQFPDHTAVDGPRKSDSSATGSQQMANDLVATVVSSQTQALLANSRKLIPSLMSGLVQGVFGGAGSAPAVQSGSATYPPNRRIVTALDSSDDSDFEILEREDCQ